MLSLYWCPAVLRAVIPCKIDSSPWSLNSLNRVWGFGVPECGYGSPSWLVTSRQGVGSDRPGSGRGGQRSVGGHEGQAALVGGGESGAIEKSLQEALAKTKAQAEEELESLRERTPRRSKPEKSIHKVDGRSVAPLELEPVQAHSQDTDPKP